MKCNSNLDLILKKYNENSMSHIFLIETNDVTSCCDSLLSIIKNIIINENDYDSNLINRMIQENNLPDLYIIEPDGNSIKKDQIENLFNECMSLPSFINKKYYIIKNADKININCENRILKFIEEPVPNVYGFMICEDYRKLLKTIVSRCQLLNDTYEISNEKEIDEEVISYINQFENVDNLLVINKEIISKYKERTEMIEFFSKIKYVYEQILNKNYFPGNNLDVLKTLDINVICDRISLISDVMERLSCNCNMELTLNYFVLELRK